MCRKCFTAFDDAAPGIFSLLDHKAKADAETFSQNYDRLRLEEGWAREDPCFYRNLPKFAPGTPNAPLWRLRAKHAQQLLTWINRSFTGRKLHILDAGGGTGWLARMLAAEGHRVMLTDLNIGPHGLDAVPESTPPVIRVQAAIEALPFLPNAFDLIVFNASMHYSPYPDRVLDAIYPMLRDGGGAIIMDSPVYRTAQAAKDALVRSRSYYAGSVAPELVESYHPLFRKDILGHPDYISSFVARDFHARSALAKSLKRLILRRSDAEFPMLFLKKRKRVAPQKETFLAALVHDGKIALLRTSDGSWRPPNAAANGQESGLEAISRSILARWDSPLPAVLHRPRQLQTPAGAHWVYLIKLSEDWPGLSREQPNIKWQGCDNLANLALEPRGIAPLVVSMLLPSGLGS